jgi:hypothetical protein
MANCAPKLRRIFFVLLICLLLPACKSKITKANYEKIKEGMTLQEVEAILGEGTKQSDGAGIPAQFGVHVPAVNTRAETYVWESGDKSITVIFVDGKVKGPITPKGL